MKLHEFLNEHKYIPNNGPLKYGESQYLIQLREHWLAKNDKKFRGISFFTVTDKDETAYWDYKNNIWLPFGE
jgi:hypothetical protein